MNEQQFRYLLDKYLQGTCTPEEVTLLHQFYDSFQREAEEPPGVLDQENVYKHIQRSIAGQERQAYERRRLKVARSRKRLKMAASVLLIIGLSIGSYVAYTNRPVPEVVWLEKTTHKGQRATIALADGTQVYLNVDSKISFPEHFEAEKRVVILEGEAFFDVARNPKRPFIITSQHLTTTVLGTSFNIKAFAGEPVEVTVASGRVKVQAPDQAGTTSEVWLNPYQQASYNGVLRKKTVDIHPFVAWREKTIRFDGVSLAEAVLVLERWFNVSIEIENEQARSCQITGQYINENLTNILNSFEHVLHIKYRTEGKKIIVEGPCK